MTYNLNHQETLDKIKDCDIFLLLSDSEPASISNIEAMAFGKPIIIKSGNGTANYLNKKEKIAKEKAEKMQEETLI